MNKKVNVSKILKALKTNALILNAKMPLGYGCGIPTVQIRNGYLCLTVPYLKYKMTGKVDKTLVYPIRNVATVSLPEGDVVAFEDLRYDKRFEKVDFSQPIGLFRHDAIKELSQKEYNEKIDEIYTLYDKMIAALLYGEEYSDADDLKLGELIRMIVEPSLWPIYKAIDEDFYNKYFV